MYFWQGTRRVPAHPECVLPRQPILLGHLPDQIDGFQGKLKWTSRELDRTIVALLEVGAIQEVQVKGAKHPQLVSAAFLDCTL
jgi:hypothetical protein